MILRSVDKLLNLLGYYKIRWVPYLSEEIFHHFIRCKYMGYWKGIYNKDGKLIDESCGYGSFYPRELWEYYIECNPLRAKEVDTIQIKYFIQAICVTDKALHTLIYEANVTEKKKWWTYGQPIDFDRLEDPRWAVVVPFKKKDRIIRWLARDNVYPGYNIHCHNRRFPIFSPDMSGTQYFVKEHSFEVVRSESL